MDFGVIEVEAVDGARLNRYLKSCAGIFAFAAFFMIGSINPVWANKISFDIPSQPLDKALVSFAETSGVQVLYKSEYTQGVISNRVHGIYEPSQALDKLIRGKALVYKFTAPDSLTLEKKIFGKTSLSLEPVEDNEGGDSFLLSENQMTENSETERDIEKPIKLPEMNVFDRMDPSSPLSTLYKVPDASTATKTNTPIIETPMAIQVVPKSVLGDQQAFSLEEALNNVSGVFPAQGFNSYDTFILRGFKTFDHFRNGFRLQTGLLATTGNRETANLERIEVLKGPASILFGRVEPGGIVNLVTKKPQAKPYFSMQQQIGSYDLYRTTVDATGSLNQDDSLLYRLNVAYEDKGSFRQFVNSDHFFVAPVLQWRISDRTQMTLELDHKNGSSTLDYGVPAIGDRPADLPVGRNLGAAFSEIEVEETIVGFNWSHAFNENWEVKHLSNYYDSLENDNVLVSAGLQADNRTLDRIYFALRDNEVTSYNTNLYLTGKVETFGVKHTVLFGGDYLYLKSESLAIGSSDVIPSVDIFNPAPFDSVPVRDRSLDFEVGSKQKAFGFSFQDQIELPHNVHFLAGFRYDNAKLESGRATTVETQQDKISPRFGLLWRPVKEVSFYGNYVENFGLPNAFNSVAVNGVPLEAETAQQFEAGIKTELLDGRLSATLAWFQLTKQNVSTPNSDPALAALGFIEQTGEAQSEGVELDITGELLPGWKLIANYAYTDTEITKSNDGNQGNQLLNVPMHAGKIWTTYAFQNKPLEGLKFGGGVTLRGESEGNNENDFQLPGYALFDLMTSYTMNVGKSRVTAQLNAKNLFDKKYFPSSTNRSIITVGTPRSFLGSLRVEF